MQGLNCSKPNVLDLCLSLLQDHRRAASVPDGARRVFPGRAVLGATRRGAPTPSTPSSAAVDRYPPSRLSAARLRAEVVPAQQHERGADADASGPLSAPETTSRLAEEPERGLSHAQRLRSCQW